MSPRIARSPVELSIVLPCLNERETVADCILRAKRGARAAGARLFEIIVADNGSHDGSQSHARRAGAKVIRALRQGYGSALQAGIRAARGRYVVIGDADLSYDFREIKPFLARLRRGDQLVMGTRLRGRILPGAMPWLHRYVGNPFLTAFGNLLFRTGFSDFHCGMRGFDRAAILSLQLRTEGMEFASEMVIRATLAGLRRGEVPIVYSPDARSRPPHLRTWRDGWRHLRFMLLFSPRWIMLYPGRILAVVGLGLTVILLPGPLAVGRLVLDVHSMLVSVTLLVTGVQLVLLSAFTRAYAERMGLLPADKGLERFLDRFPLEVGLGLGLLLAFAGTMLYAVGISRWGSTAFGPIEDLHTSLRIVISGSAFLLLGLQVFFSSFLLSLLSLRESGNPRRPHGASSADSNQRETV